MRPFTDGVLITIAAWVASGLPITGAFRFWCGLFAAIKVVMFFRP